MNKLSSSELLERIHSENTRQVKSITEARDNMRTFHRQFRSDIEVHIEAISIGEIQAFEIWGPQASRDKIILFFHGGGFVVGCTEDHLELCGRLSYAASMPVLSIDYRLSPEYAFPVALENCIASFEWLISSGISPSAIVPVGISAGGNLAISMCMKLRDMNCILPGGIICMSPAVNLASSHNTSGGINDWLRPEVLDLARRVYVRDNDIKNPLISPLFGNLEGLPEIYLQAGSHELLFNDIVSFSETAKESGARIILNTWEGMFHCWQMFASVFEPGQKAVDAIGTHIREQIFR